MSQSPEERPRSATIARPTKGAASGPSGGGGGDVVPPPDAKLSGRNKFIGAMFLMATSAIGPGFITQTTTFTDQLMAAFAFAILASILFDIAIQLNVWRVIGVSGRRAQDLANSVFPGSGYVLAALDVLGGLVFNIGNIAGCSLGLDAIFGLDVRLGAAISAAVAIGIFLLLKLVYRSWRLALLSFVALPSALVGGLLAVYASGGVISLGSLIGFLAVFGLATRNAVVLINRYQYMESSEGEAFGLGLVLRGAQERPAAILMTALATGLMLVPSLILGNIPGLEIIRPMAIVMLGGLVTSTLFSLFVVPTLYLRYGASREADIELLPTNAVDLPAVAADD